MPEVGDPVLLPVANASGVHEGEVPRVPAVPEGPLDGDRHLLGDPAHDDAGHPERGAVGDPGYRLIRREEFRHG